MNKLVYFLIFVSPMVDGANVFKCTKDGEIVFTNIRCEDGAELVERRDYFYEMPESVVNHGIPAKYQHLLTPALTEEDRISQLRRVYALIRRDEAQARRARDEAARWQSLSPEQRLILKLKKDAENQEAHFSEQNDTIEQLEDRIDELESKLKQQ